ncbi:DMT family transporter [Polycyclovorans algicola]|uniref:DMT family transporter n=1 Tax=Polycyclovorans algicola TaxID=616992 RepID=UPI000693DA43|nr:DMT family transporter [Polycyclovorans algicola]
MTPIFSSASAGGLLFVLLWSSGYLGAHFALQGFAPFTATVLRFAGSALIIGVWVALRRSAGPAPTKPDLLRAALAGLFLQAGFFGFTYAAMHTGASAAAAGLIAGLMPLLTALGGRVFLGESLGRYTVPGALIGLTGVGLVLTPMLATPGTLLGLMLALCALASLSGGTLLQRRHPVALEPRTALLVQLLVALVILLPFAALEGFAMTPTPAAIAGVVWVTLINSCCGLLLYLWLLRTGSARVVSGWFYLVPPVTGVMAMLVLGDRFGLWQWTGFALAAVGVWLAQRGPALSSNGPTSPSRE